MLKSLNYMRLIFSLFIFLLMSACGNNGGFFNNRMSGEEFGDPKEASPARVFDTSNDLQTGEDRSKKR